ncbi:hypothetical protein CDL12_14611 [Handroanthus impetiginosus]|uniref:Uncharacterized protein n=1 Tax=Handroanthus impetiginosus TaxID=429701 RepID=A0A2G9H5I1_9LAMI|nr:hypothetical protein CDL12_14611 [Handroanthus impetiginosus]
MLSPHISLSLFCEPYNKAFSVSTISTALVPCALSLPKISTQLLYNGCGFSLSLEAPECIKKINITKENQSYKECHKLMLTGKNSTIVIEI